MKFEFSVHAERALVKMNFRKKPVKVVTVHLDRSMRGKL